MIRLWRASDLIAAFLIGVAIKAESQTGTGSGFHFEAAPQRFEQETGRRFTAADGGPLDLVSLIDSGGDGVVRAFSDGKWWEFRAGRWKVNEDLSAPDEGHFIFADRQGKAIRVECPWREARQVLRSEKVIYVAGAHGCWMVSDGGGARSLDWPEGLELWELAVSPDGILHAGSSSGLWKFDGAHWERIEARDGVGRAWAVGDVPGVGFDAQGRLWFASKAGVGCQTTKGWRFFEGKDGLPWNDFTWIAAPANGEMWFATHLGVERFDGKTWAYRQGPRWLPGDDVKQAAVDAAGNLWVATTGGLGVIERRKMTLAEKAEVYERDIERVKRTPYGYVSVGPLQQAGDKSSASPQDDDNDGLWTAMYGAGECFDYGATKDAKAKERARGAFEALRFLQKVTQGGEHSPPKGYVARSIRPTSGPDPNIGLLANDQREHEHGDRLWKVYEPRWPKSADGKWYWKSDTSSDELDGHYFFYALYYEMCADTDAERARVQEVVRDLTDDLLTHDFNLIDFDGMPTRWGAYGPSYLNRSPDWWAERGLKSLSMLSYLADAEFVTGDPKYAEASRELIDKEGYAQNAMFSKLQRGPGTGNQSDNEMAFMSYYNLLRYSHDEALKRMIRASFYLYWLNMAPEMNPFFNFAYAAENGGATGATPWGTYPLSPWPDWQLDAMATLRGFPLDWINWPLRNSHRLDVEQFPSTRASDPESSDSEPRRGNLVNGKVLPVENRYFDHWNTDPWELDYGGNGDILGAGTVFLLPYYMGLYHGFIQKP
jgi:hypothetical protein